MALSGPVVFAGKLLAAPPLYTHCSSARVPPPVGNIKDVSSRCDPRLCSADRDSVVGQGDSACTSRHARGDRAPEPFIRSPGATGDFEFVLHLTTPARFADAAFLKVNFTTSDPACATLATRPQLLTGAACTSCVSWNSSVAGMQELCAVQIPGSPVMYANVTSCVVPVLSARGSREAAVR